MDHQGGVVQPLGLECEAASPSAVAPNSVGLDKSLAAIVTQFFEKNSVPPAAQERFLNFFENLYIYNLNALREYSLNFPEDFKSTFGAFAAYCFKPVQVPQENSHQNDPSGPGGLGLDVLEYFKANSVSSRSITSARDNMLGLQQPYDTSGVDLSLLHPAFSSFVKNFRKMESNNDQWYNLGLLFRCVSTSSAWSGQKILKVLRDLLSVKIKSPYHVVGEKMTISGAYCGHNTELPALLVVVKNSGDTFMTGITFYHHCLGNGLLERRHSPWIEYFYESCCPCFLLEIQGRQIRVSGLAMLTKVTCTSFTHLLNLYGDPIDVVEVAGALQALSEAVVGLGMFISGFPRPFTVSFRTNLQERRRWDYILSGRSPRPFLLDKYSDVRQLVGGSFAYCVDTQFVVKYVQRYSEEVHRAWASQGLAPKLVSVEPLPGGYLEVKMEYLSKPWMQLDLLPSEDDCLAVLTALESAHRILVTIGEQVGFGVHGDARPENVLINRTTNEVVFIDFELSGLGEISVYPYNLSSAKFWPFRIDSCRPVQLLREHDKSFYVPSSLYRIFFEKSPFQRQIESSREEFREFRQHVETRALLTRR